MAHIQYSALPLHSATKVKDGAKFAAVPVGKDLIRMNEPVIQYYSTTFTTDMLSGSNTAAQVVAIKRISDLLVRHMYLRIALVVATNPVTLVPCQRWFEQLDFSDPKDMSHPFQTQFDDTLLTNLLLSTPEWQQSGVFKTNNIESGVTGKYSNAKELPVGTHYFYIPLLKSVIDQFGGLYLGEIDGDDPIAL